MTDPISSSSLLREAQTARIGQLIEQWRKDAKKFGAMALGIDELASTQATVIALSALANEHADELSTLLSSPPPQQETNETEPVNNNSDILRECGMDGYKWAKAFMRQHGDKRLTRNLTASPDNGLVDEGDMLAWFCNAIMSGYDEAQRRQSAQLASLHHEITTLRAQVEQQTKDEVKK